MRNIALSLALSAASVVTHAQSFGNADVDIAAALAEAQKATQIDDITTIPVKSLRAIESEGQIYYASENGRYVISGRLIDVLQRKPLDTMDQIKESVSRLSFEQLGMDIDTLNTVTIGTGPVQVVTFIDPLCPVCIQVMKDAQPLANDYTFKFIVVPALGEKSNTLARRVQCAKEPDDLVPAIMQGKLGTLPVKSNCQPPGYDMTLLVAHLMDVNGVPFMIAPNGEIARGRPVDLSSWLQERTQ